MTQADVVAHVLGILDDLGIDYMVAGSFASNYHGAPRMTQDADIVVDARFPVIRALVERLAPDFYVSEDAARQAVQTRQPGSLAGRTAMFATAEDTILTKLEWARLGQSERQYQDAAQLVRLQSDRLDWAYIEHWAEHLGVGELVARLRRGAAWADP
jgi:hypothetical protein